MKGLEPLTTLDLYLWLGHGGEVARLLQVNQSTISRQIQTALKQLDLRLVRLGPQPFLLGDSELLQALRHALQIARLKGLAPLRIDGTYCSGPWFLQEPFPGWIAGRSDLPGLRRPLQLLEERVLDAWVGSYQPDLPDADNPQWLVIDLLQVPVQLLAAADHPLAGEQGLIQGDLLRFPSLALPTGWFPRTEAVLRSQGLWQDPLDMPRYDPASWEGRCADGVTLTYGQSLTEALQPGTVRLDWNLQLLTGEALVVRRDLAERAPIQALIERLRGRAREIAGQLGDVGAVG
ncbi:MAG: LysR family transcriptional regulator [Cyanobium sp.]